MTTPAIPAGMAPVFPGWNVWSLWQADEPDQGVLGTIWHAGESNERLLRVWVEDQIRDNAPGAAVADPANPAALSGDPVLPIPHPTGLDITATRAEIPELAGATQLGTKGSTAQLVSVRFFNRGNLAVLPWPHDANFLLDTVWTPSASSPLTTGPGPGTLAGAASAAASAAGHALETVAWLAAAGAALALAIALARRSK
jgi:hypothetical protein